MKVINIINSRKKPFVSFELVPPLKGSDMSKLYQSIEPLMEFEPPFINITYHRDEEVFRENQDGTFRKVTITKRPGSVAIAAAIVRNFSVEVVPHLICGGNSRQKLENDLMDLHFLGIHNVVALRGDAIPVRKYFTPEVNGHQYCCELVQQINDMNQGKYLEKELTDVVSTDFCVGVAGYPEKHYESPNLHTDIMNLKTKIDAGADYIITQMFFDNQKFYDFVNQCREAGIHVPIIPGLKPLSSTKHIEMLPKTFGIDLPEELMRQIRQCCDDKSIYELGMKWCITQSTQLLQYGVPAIHYYTMGTAENVKHCYT
ncbi:MAG: methylenetetrahydrofolate reductase [Bacteroidales bacterium]|jgi:methylenetetrahydrofolate reductase (NADPH)|nr:methylenetetrahydrofolate reductase [Bacteroidales bacterium]